jgi:CelD/BcsL family acetyltransferase involved in cellulose biosynthesis
VRAFIEQLTARMGPTGRLRFSCLEWNGRAIAYEYAWVYRGTYFGGPSCFATDLASRSPGQVLERQLMLAAISEEVGTYDFGIGDEPYKFRYATDVRRVKTWETWQFYPLGCL